MLTYSPKNRKANDVQWTLYMPEKFSGVFRSFAISFVMSVRMERGLGSLGTDIHEI